MENADRTITRDASAESAGTPCQGREGTHAEQILDPSQQTSQDEPHDLVLGPQKNIRPPAPRALKEPSTRAFLTKLGGGHRIGVSVRPDRLSLLGVRSDQLFIVELVVSGRVRQLVIRKRTHRGLRFIKTAAWLRLTAPFEGSVISELFGGQTRHLIASDVILADDGTVRIVLPDAPISPPPDAVPSDAARGSTGPDEQAPSQARLGESAAAFSSAIPADQLGRGGVARIGRGPRNSYRGVCTTNRGRWHAALRFNKRSIWLGDYPTEHQAAYAFNLAERILYGDEARLNAIPKQHEPSPQSVALINARVDFALRKSGLTGNPLDRNSRFRLWSRERGVSWHRHSGRWHANLRHQDRRLSLGYYKTRHEAELAYNHAVRLLHRENAWLNEASPEDRPSEVDERAIQAKVAEKLRRYGY